MRLTTVEKVRAAMGFADVDQYNSVVKAHLDLSTQRLRGALRSEFDATVVTDVFYVGAEGTIRMSAPGVSRARSQAFTGRSDLWRTSLMLTRPFVDSAASYAVYSAGTIGDLGVPAVRTDLAADTATTLVRKDEKGILDIIGIDLTGLFVQVEYECGFGIDAEDPGAYDPAEVPDWLVETAVIDTRVALLRHPVFEGGDNAEPSDEKELREILRTLIMGHVRYNPLHLRPLQTTTV